MDTPPCVFFKSPKNHRSEIWMISDVIRHSKDRLALVARGGRNQGIRRNDIPCNDIPFLSGARLYAILYY